MKLDGKAWAMMLLTGATVVSLIIVPDDKRNTFIGLVVFCISVSIFYVWRINPKSDVFPKAE